MKNAGKVREICQSEKVGTMILQSKIEYDDNTKIHNYTTFSYVNKKKY